MPPARKKRRTTSRGVSATSTSVASTAALAAASADANGDEHVVSGVEGAEEEAKYEVKAVAEAVVRQEADEGEVAIVSAAEGNGSGVAEGEVNGEGTDRGEMEVNGIEGREADAQEPEGFEVEEVETDEQKKERETRERIYAEFAEEYYDVVDQLPLEINRNFTLIAEWEAVMQESEEKLHDRLHQYLKLMRPEAAAAASDSAEDKTTPPIAEALSSAAAVTDGAVESVTEGAQPDAVDVSPSRSAPPSQEGRADSEAKQPAPGDVAPASPETSAQPTIVNGADAAPSETAEDDEAAVAAQLLALAASAPTPVHSTFTAAVAPAERTVSGTVGETEAVMTPANTLPMGGVNGDVEMVDATSTDPVPAPAVDEANSDAVAAQLEGKAATTEGSEEEKQKKDQQRRKLLLEIASLMNTSIKRGQDKVNLATTVYDWVDRHINRLDADLLKFEDANVLGLRRGTLPSTDAPSAAHFAAAHPPSGRRLRLTGAFAAARGEGERAGQRKGLVTHRARDKQKQKDKKPGRAENVDVGARRGASVDRGGTGGTPAAGTRRSASPDKQVAIERGGMSILAAAAGRRGSRWLPTTRAAVSQDMEIDPNEPRYCYCNQVSFGTMVGCDNPECEREWFHLSCVGLKGPPANNWYCRECAPKKH